MDQNIIRPGSWNDAEVNMYKFIKYTFTYLWQIYIPADYSIMTYNVKLWTYVHYILFR